MNNIEDAVEVSAVRDYLIRSAPKFKESELDMDADLLGTGVLDSLGILQLTTFLAETFGIEVADEDFLPENFQTISNLVRFIQIKRMT